jgi:hypothetical protein
VCLPAVLIRMLVGTPVNYNFYFTIFTTEPNFMQRSSQH